MKHRSSTEDLGERDWIVGLTQKITAPKCGTIYYLTSEVNIMNLTVSAKVRIL